ncbi:hypothetical protein D3C81_827170 [compost metagenome]
MSIFAVIPTSESPPILDSIRASGLPFFLLPRGEILVAYNGTSKALSDAIGISEGDTGHGVIFSVSSYFGRTTPDTWEWIKANWSN